jgi:hypothetical protein
MISSPRWDSAPDCKSLTRLFQCSLRMALSSEMAGFILYVSSNNVFIPFHAKFLAATAIGVTFLANIHQAGPVPVAS